jgi:hypothetical protein
MRSPRVNFFPWELEVRNEAASVCKTLCHTGLLSTLLTNAQWANYPTNITTDSQGNVVIAPPYVPQPYVQLNDQMSNVALMVARTSNEQTLEWITGEETLKAAIVKSLGRVIRQIIPDPNNGLTLMTISEIMDKVRAMYDRMRKTTNNSLAERMTPMCGKQQRTTLLNVWPTTIHRSI